jgi:polar amino acid transport system substrate-binding protein
MIFKKIWLVPLFILLIFTICLFFNASGEKDLKASLAQLPGLADTPDKGAFVDIVKAIDDVYTDGKITIELFPFPRSYSNIIQGKADFHMPSLRNPLVDEKKLPYRIVTERMGVVSLVIYSNVNKIITKKMIDDAVAKGGKFPYKIEAGGGMEDLYPFPITASNNLEQTMQKINSNRIDALIWAQEEPDLVLKKMKLKTIHREHYQDLDDVIITTKNPRGEEVNKILSTAIKKLRASGRLQKLYEKTHKPYDNWQPANMGW